VVEGIGLGIVGRGVVVGCGHTADVRRVPSFKSWRCDKNMVCTDEVSRSGTSVEVGDTPVLE
jgi:hypothetical protein